MTPAARKLLNDVLGLPEEDRARIATEVLASLDDPANSGWDEAWAAELERRQSAAAERGEPAPEWGEVRANVLRLLEEREQRVILLRQALAEGEAGGDAGALDFDEIRRKARERGADA